MNASLQHAVSTASAAPARAVAREIIGADRQPLRAYQDRTVRDVRTAMRSGHRHVLLQLATGAGKTRIAAEIERLSVVRGLRGLFLAPRRELIHQAAAAFRLQGIPTGVIMAGVDPHPDAPLQVASLDTLYVRGVQSERMELPDADLVIVDEAHLAAADSRRAILDRYQDRHLIGLTATPARADGRGLGELFDSMVSGPSVAELVQGGWLVPVRYFAPHRPELEKIRLNRHGDYQQKSLSECMRAPAEVKSLVETWLALGEGRSTAVFCVDHEHGKAVCAAFRKAKVSAEYVDANTPLDERGAIFKRVADGATTVLVNVALCTFGVDIPRLSCAVLARPTRDVVLYLQIVGRVLRPSPDTGKKDALVIDHAGAVLEHGFADRVRPWSLARGSDLRAATLNAAAKSAEPLVMVCPKCHTVSSGVRTCPGCGYTLVAAGVPIPVYQAAGDALDLAAPGFREAFYSTALAYQAECAYKDGWTAHRYFDVFGEWPDRKALEDVKPAWCNQVALNMLKRAAAEYKQRARIDAARKLGLFGGQAWADLGLF
ncbi:MAG TPA: DEAD/DEAH box helicase [Rhodanobacteraceae bacterium]